MIAELLLILAIVGPFPAPPPGSSPAIGAAECPQNRPDWDSLSSDMQYSLSHDMLGNPRPGPYGCTIGALEVPFEVGAAPAAPTGLIVEVE